MGAHDWTPRMGGMLPDGIIPGHAAQVHAAYGRRARAGADSPLIQALKVRRMRPAEFIVHARHS